jgi:hypothetical protein
MKEQQDLAARCARVPAGNHMVAGYGLGISAHPGAQAGHFGRDQGSQAVNRGFVGSRRFCAHKRR